MEYKPARLLRRPFPELEGMRQLCSKTYDLGGRKRELVQVQGPVHYQEEGQWQEIDLTPIDKGDHWEIAKGLYAIKIYKDRPAIEYVNRNGDFLNLELDEVGGEAPATPSVALDGMTVNWDGVAEDFGLILNFRPAGIKLEKELRSPLAPTDWAFRMETSMQGLENRAQGRDADGNAADIASSIAKGRLRQRFNSRVSKIVDPATRKRGWFGGAEWPVRIA